MRLIIPLALILSGCATVPAPKIETKTVYVPQPVACVDPASVKAEPAPTGNLPANASQAADLLGAKVLELRAWGRSLVAVISPCTKQP